MPQQQALVRELGPGVQVAPGETTRADFVIAPRGALAGVVRTADGAVASGAIIKLFAANMSAFRVEEIIASAEGRYHVDLPAGAYRVGARVDSKLRRSASAT